MVLGKSFCGFEHPPIDLRSRSIQDALEKDIDTRKVVKDLIKESRKENVWAFGIAIVQYILSFIAGGGLVYFFKYLP